MARLRLFANLREAAGTGSANIPGDTVGEVVAAAVGRFGAEFEQGLASARVWLNGEPAEADAPIGDDDELALIPPVSGGATVVRSPAGMELILVVVVAAALFLANGISVQWLAVTAVLAGGVWAFDLAEVTSRRGMLVGAVPLMVAICGSALATYRFAVPGMAGAMVGSGLVALTWSVLNPRFRPIESVAATTLISIVAAAGTSAMVLLRLRSEDEMLAFLVIVSISIAGSWIADQARVRILDPLVIGILGAVAGGVIAGSVWLDDLWATLVAAGAAAMAIVAGRNLGTLLRAGGFFVSGPVPGSLHYLDGVVMAAGAFWLIIDLLT
jgi:molybdopterin converting factor small subunit